MSDIHSLSGVTEAKAKSVIRQHRKASFYVKKYLMIFVGALIAAIGLELFLIPNNVIDGGVVGISIMMSSITGLSLGVFLVLLNIPFLYLGYKQIGKNFAIATTIAICILSVLNDALCLAADTVRGCGLAVTPQHLLTPRKSTTAILGIADHPVTGTRAGCATCHLRDTCSFRKRGTTCFTQD